MNGKVAKVLRKLSKEKLLNYNMLKDKFKELNSKDRADVIRDINILLKHE